MNDIVGRKVKDVITGFEGVVPGYVTYISGCNQALVVPPVANDGKLVEAEWFDEQRLERIGAVRLELDNAAAPGAYMAPPKR